MDSHLITVLWMWLTPPIALCLALYFLYRSGYLLSGIAEVQHRWWVPNILLLITILLCVAYQAEVNKVGWVGEWIVYAIFEYLGSWVIGGMVLCFNTRIFDAKQTYLNQTFNFNLDPAELGPDKYAVRILENEFSRVKKFQLVLYRTVRKVDITGEYIVFQNEHSFECQEKQFYTKERIRDTLKDYFEAKQVFQVEGDISDLMVVEVAKKKPTVIVID